MDSYIKSTTGYPTYDAFFQSTASAPLYDYYHVTFTEGLLAPDVINVPKAGLLQSNAQLSMYSQLYHIYSSAEVQTYNSNIAPDASQYGSFLVRNSSLTPVPVPAAAWLFGSALVGFVGFNRRKSA